MQITWTPPHFERAIERAQKSWSGLKVAFTGQKSSEHAGRVAASCWVAVGRHESDRTQILQDAWDAFGPAAFNAAFSRPVWERRERWETSGKFCLPFEMALRLNMPDWSERLAHLCPKVHVATARIRPGAERWPQSGRADISGPGGALGALCDEDSAHPAIRARLMNIYMQCREAPKRGPELMAALSMLAINDPARKALLAWVESGEIDGALRQVMEPARRPRTL